MLINDSYGFTWGPLSVARFMSREGWVILGCKSKKHDVQVYCTKTGKIRVYLDGVEMLVKNKFDSTKI